MKAISAGLRTHLDKTVTTLATLWKITRTDAATFFFTDHDNDVVFSGDTYKARTGYSRTAVENDASLSVGNLDVEGIFDSADITEAELRAGLFDYAEIRVSVVDYTNPDTNGELKIRRGWFGEVVVTRQGVFQTELRGLSQALSQNILEIYQPECRTDLGDSRCKVPITPPVLGRNQVLTLGEQFRVSTSTADFTVSNGVSNQSFEQDSIGSAVASILGDWTIISGTWDIHDATNEGLSPSAGTNYLEGGAAAAGEVRQDISLADILPSTVNIDAGSVTATFSVQRANSTVDADQGRVIVEYLDTNKTIVSTQLDTGLEVMSSVDTWFARSFSSAVVPANTRYIRIRFLYVRIAGAEANTSFDDIQLSLDDSGSVPPPTQAQYENRIYTVTTAGTTDAIQPGYSITPASTTTDGTAVLTAEQSFMRDAEVTEATDRRNFKISVVDSRAIDGWFDGGALVFENTTNAGKGLEIKNWVLAGETIELFLPVPFNIVVGSKIRLYPGCDKRRSICLSKYNNVINFRGEPDLPGQDDLIRYPDARL